MTILSPLYVEVFLKLSLEGLKTTDFTSPSVQTLGEASDGLSNLPSPFAYLLTIHLKEGRNLVIRDRCGKA